MNAERCKRIRDDIALIGEHIIWWEDRPMNKLFQENFNMVIVLIGQDA